MLNFIFYRQTKKIDVNFIKSNPLRLSTRLSKADHYLLNI